jgi:hypothetical protein
MLMFKSMLLQQYMLIFGIFFYPCRLGAVCCFVWVSFFLHVDCVKQLSVSAWDF